MKLIRRPATCLVAIAFALGVATTASADVLKREGGVLDPDSLFDRGRMSVELGGVLADTVYTGRKFEIFASGHGTVSVEVYDQTDALLGTVTGKLTAFPGFDSDDDVFLALTVTINRVASGVNGCTSQFNEMVCDLVVPTPPSGTTESASLRLVASVRGNVDVADFNTVIAEGQGYGEATFVHTVSLEGVTGPSDPPPSDRVEDATTAGGRGDGPGGRGPARRGTPSFAHLRG